MTQVKPFTLSILDLTPVADNTDIVHAFSHALQLAKLAESLDYTRYWLAEHHNISGIASAATAVLIGYLAANTRHLRLGAGGIMLPNHTPLLVAEQFGTLQTLYPDRIDLGLGRAPGTDQQTMRALRRHQSSQNHDTFPSDVKQLLDWFDADPQHDFAVKPVPGQGLRIPIWLLGSSLYSATLAAKLGLPFAFASHFAPSLLVEALQIYRQQFQPSARLAKPYVIAGINIVAADTTQQADWLFTSHQQHLLNLIRGKGGRLPAPVEQMQSRWLPHEKRHIEHALSMSLVGDVQYVTAGLTRWQQQLEVDEFIVNGHIYDPAARLHSFTLAMHAAQQVVQSRKST